MTRALCLWFLVVVVKAPAVMADDWPQYQHDPARTGYTDEEVAPPYRLAWRYSFLPERPARRTQAIIYDQKVYVGTQQGFVHCIDAATGERLWRAEGLGNIQHSAGCADGRVVVTSLDGCVYALDAETGERLWQRQTGAGLSVAPLIVDGAVYAGNRRGRIVALNLADGELLWSAEVGGPVLNTAAADAERLYIGADDMRLYALSLATGEQAWCSEQVYGMTFKDYCPVVHQGHVFVRPMASFEADIYTGVHSPYGGWPNNLPGGWWPVWTSAPGDLPNFQTRYDAATAERAGEMPQELLDRQQPVIEHYRNYPADQDLYIFDAATGEPGPPAPHFRVQAMHGPVTPPVVDQYGTLVMPWVHINHCWGRYDLDSNRMVELMIPPRPTNADENLNVSVGGRYLFVFHCQEGNANHTGIYDMVDRQWHANPGPGVTWYDNQQSGANPVSIGAGHYYHILFYTLVARTSEGAAP